MIISIGWMTQVASIPAVPPLTKGLIVGQTPEALGFFSSPIFLRFKAIENRGREKEGADNEGEKGFGKGKPKLYN